MANYNCSDSSNNAYGAGAYGTCTGQSVGAPNTGIFQEFVGSGSFTIVAPLALAVIVVVIATTIIKLRNRKKTTPTDASL